MPIAYNFYAICPCKEPRLMCTLELQPGETGVSVNRCDCGQPTKLASEIFHGIAQLDQASMRARGNSINGKGLAKSEISVHKEIYGLAQTTRDSAGFLSTRSLTKTSQRERRARVMGANLSPKMGSTRTRGRTGPRKNDCGDGVGGRK